VNRPASALDERDAVHLARAVFLTFYAVQSFADRVLPVSPIFGLSDEWRQSVDVAGVCESLLYWTEGVDAETVEELDEGGFPTPASGAIWVAHSSSSGVQMTRTGPNSLFRLSQVRPQITPHAKVQPDRWRRCQTSP